LLPAQTPCSIEWAGNVNPAVGSLNNSFTAAGGIAGTWVTTNPTFGSFNAGRPNFFSAYSIMLGTSRGGGFGAKTTMKFASPVDFYRLRIWDLRGDGFTSEAQRVEAFNAGVSVTRMYSTDNPALVSINAGTNTISGSTTTNATNQGLVHVSFATAVDSIVVRSVGNSDFVVIELLCPDGATDVSLTPLRAAYQPNENVRLYWSTLFENNHSHFEIERSANGLLFEKVGSINGSGNRWITTEYSFTDDRPLYTATQYRLKIVSLTGNYFYSEIVTVRVREKIRAVYDAASKNIVIHQPAGKTTAYYLYDGMGALRRKGFLSQTRNTIPASNFSARIYYLKAEPGGIVQKISIGF
jgi:hypothetical protein